MKMVNMKIHSSLNPLIRSYLRGPLRLQGIENLDDFLYKQTFLFEKYQ